MRKLADASEETKAFAGFGFFYILLILLNRLTWTRALSSVSTDLDHSTLFSASKGPAGEQEQTFRRAGTGRGEKNTGRTKA